MSLSQLPVQALSIPPVTAALTTIALLLSFFCATLAFAAVHGRISRILTRQDSNRVFTAVFTASLIVTALIAYALWPIFDVMFHGAVASRFLLLSASFGLSAFLPSLSAFIGSLQSYRTDRSDKLAQTCLAIAELLTWWRPKLNRANGSQPSVDDEPEFEITMASGEEVEAEERAYIENILELGDTTADEVMTPRTDVIALDVDWSPEKMLEIIADSRFSRFPVYESSVDNIIGILHLRDVLEFLARGEGIGGMELREMIMEPNFVPGSRKVDDVLRDLQRKKSHLAVVLDEYGGTAGILTIEDLLEEIVGEIQDEYDEDVKHIHQREDGKWLVSAQIKLDDLNEILNLGIEDEDVDTLGGFISGQLGRIPNTRENIDYAKWRMTVLSVARNRIGRVLIERKNAADTF